MMFGTWTFGKKLFAGFAIAAIVLVLVGAFGYRTTHAMVESARWVAHTNEVRRSATELMALVMDAESGARGFVASGKDTFLAHHDDARSRVDRALGDLQRLTVDNPVQQRRIAALRPVVVAKIEILRRHIETRRNQGLEAAALAVATGEGLQNTNEIRRIIGEIDGEEGQLLRLRHTEAEENARTTENVILWGSLLGITFVIVVGWLIATSLTNQVGSAVRHIQGSSAELQAAANQQASGAKEQATAMNEITTTINELLATSRQIAESAQRVTAIASDTASVAQDGDQLVQRTNESMASIKRQVDQVVSHMLDLGKKSQEIGGILDIINELADQTNILAINATIEAAGAGEGGRRFGVVAEEIRRLADRVGSSTKAIRELIDDVRTAVNTTVMATETGTKAVDAGVRQFAEATMAFGRIANMVGTTTEAAREIELSTKQQSTAVEQVNVAATNVAQATKETEASSGQTLQTAAQLATLSRDLLQIVQANQPG